jgi:hypothetical protein
MKKSFLTCAFYPQCMHNMAALNSVVDTAKRYGLDGLGSIPSADDIFRARPDRPRSLLSLFYNEYRIFLGSKVAEAWF